MANRPKHCPHALLWVTCLPPAKGMRHVIHSVLRLWSMRPHIRPRPGAALAAPRLVNVTLNGIQAVPRVLDGFGFLEFGF